MAVFSKHEIISASASLIPEMAQAIVNDFQSDGFEVKQEQLLGGGIDISLTKGDIFKSVLGMKSALKVSLRPSGNGVMFDANVGIFRQQVIPTIISLFFLWPVMITQIWGLVEQAKLDDRALADAQSVVGKPAAVLPQAHSAFCSQCGKPVPEGSRFCPYCGAQI